MQIEQIVAYKIKDQSDLPWVQGALKNYLIEYDVWEEGRDMTKEGHSFAAGSAFHEALVREGKRMGISIIDTMFEPVYYADVNAVDAKYHIDRNRNLITHYLKIHEEHLANLKSFKEEFDKMTEDKTLLGMDTYQFLDFVDGRVNGRKADGYKPTEAEVNTLRAQAQVFIDHMYRPLQYLEDTEKFIANLKRTINLK